MLHHKVDVYINVQLGHHKLTLLQTEDTPLHLACEKGHTGTAQMLIDRGADVNKEDSAREIPLHVACENGHTETAQLLIDKGSNVNQQNLTEDTPLYLAYKNGHTGTAQMLIDRGTDVNQRRARGMLVDRGADVNREDRVKMASLNAKLAREKGHNKTPSQNPFFYGVDDAETYSKTVDPTKKFLSRHDPHPMTTSLRSKDLEVSLNAQLAREKGHNKTPSQNPFYSPFYGVDDAETDSDFSRKIDPVKFPSHPDPHPKIHPKDLEVPKSPKRNYTIS